MEKERVPIVAKQLEISWYLDVNEFIGFTLSTNTLAKVHTTAFCVYTLFKF
jgi:hypothetical protein